MRRGQRRGRKVGRGEVLGLYTRAGAYIPSVRPRLLGRVALPADMTEAWLGRSEWPET